MFTISSRPEGALEILNVEDPSPLTEIAAQYPLVLDIFKYSWINQGAEPQQRHDVRLNTDKVLPSLILTFKGTDGVTLLRFVGDFLQQLDSEVSNLTILILRHSNASQCLSSTPKWLQPLILLLQNLVLTRPSANSRSAYTQLAAALLQAYPSICPKLLFTANAEMNSESKPFSYLFINLLLIDIRSSFPSLLAQLNDPQYPATSRRLAAAFDVISSFIGFLVRSMDGSRSSAFSMPPDLLLKLRKDLSETISLTVEYLRDRWDASVAGASGLHPDAISGTAATSEGTRLTLTWESIKDNVSEDGLIFAGIQTMAIWIREDDNENLRNECAGLMDMFMELYKTGAGGSSDFRYPILLALEGFMIAEDGVERFLAQNAWQILSDDLQAIVRTTSSISSAQATLIIPEANRGLQIVRVLLAVVDSETTSYPEESWMDIIKIAASMKVSVDTPIALELQIAMLQISTALMNKASGGMVKRHVTSHDALSGVVQQLRTAVSAIPDKNEGSDLLGLLDDVSLELENIR